MTRVLSFSLTFHLFENLPEQMIVWVFFLTIRIKVNIEVRSSNVC